MYTLGDLPRNGAMFFPDNIAVVYEDSRFTYREFNNRVNRFSNALINFGIQEGRPICVMADNCSKYLEVYFGAAKIGICVTPINCTARRPGTCLYHQPLRGNPVCRR